MAHSAKGADSTAYLALVWFRKRFELRWSKQRLVGGTVWAVRAEIGGTSAGDQGAKSRLSEVSFSYPGSTAEKFKNTRRDLWLRCSKSEDRRSCQPLYTTSSWCAESGRSLIDA